MISLPGLKYPYAPVHVVPPELGQQDPDSHNDEHLALSGATPRHKLWAWLGTIWPLVLHFIGALGITVLLVYYIDDNHFNIRDRRPEVTFADGTTTRTNRYSPLQSDINTILSATLVVLRWIAAAWAGPLCWRTLFFLMEKTGLRRRDLEWLIGYGFFPPSTHLRHAFIIIVAATLTSTLFAQSASPVLTGSITWVPSSISSGVQSDAFINVPVATNYSIPWQLYQQPSVQANVAVKAAGFANQAWGRDIEKGVLKRVLPSANRLNVNSTIANLTLPYFQVTSLDWISDLPADNITILTLYEAGLGMQSDYLEQAPGMLAILPNTRRSMRQAYTINTTRWPFPAPSTVSETRLLMLNTGRVETDVEGEANEVCRRPELGGRISQSLPQSMGYIFSSISCLAFARVTYTAGVGVCTNCRLSSPSTAQNDSEIALEPDTMTTEALWNMPNVTANLVLMNTSIPLPWENVEEYVMEVLFRSYSGAWSALHEVMTDPSDIPLTSRVYPTLPSLQAQLDLRRVYAWLALQLLVTCTGIFFLWLQSRSKFALMGDTTMVAFDLDTTDAPKNNESDQPEAKNILKIEPKDGGWKVVVDPQSPPKSL